VNIQFADQKFAKEVNDTRLLQRRHGLQRAKLIRRRLDELRAAQTLDEIRSLPAARCHELHGNRTGQLAVNLDQPYRLILTPTPPIPTKPDGGLDWTRVTAIIVLAIEDYHD
jgi:plasmid maintenance system killer protein